MRSTIVTLFGLTFSLKDVLRLGQTESETTIVFRDGLETKIPKERYFPLYSIEIDNDSWINRYQEVLNLWKEIHGPYEVAPHNQKKSYNQIKRERNRQVHVEGYTVERDIELYKYNELLHAASAYMFDCEKHWPWPRKLFKPSNKIRNLVKAGALICAEIDRLQAIEAQTKEMVQNLQSCGLVAKDPFIEGFKNHSTFHMKG